MASTVLSVSWKDHSGALTDVCKSLLDNNFLVDCTIAAEGKALKAHRLILSACSPYFQMLFGESYEKHPIVILQHASFEILKAMIDFMYHGETQVPEENLEAFLTLAETLQIKGLNDSSKKSRRKLQSDTSTRETRHRPPPDDQTDACEVQISNVSHEPSPESSSEQHHSYRSDVYADVAQNCTVSLEGDNSVYEQVKQTPVIQSSQQQLPSVSQVSSEVEENVKSEPMHHVFLVPKHEQMDEDDGDDGIQDVSETDINEEAVPTFDEQDMNQYSNAPSCSESTNVMPGAFVMPQMAGPPDVQGIWGPPPQENETAFCQGEQRRQKSETSSSEQTPHSSCSAAFTTFQGLALPYRMHMDVIHHECDVCGKTFARRDHFIIHQRVHTGERPFKCNVCSKAFTQASHLAAHKRVHTGELPYPCDVCGKAFRQSGVLASHRKRHGTLPYACDVCGRTVSTAGELAAHKRRHSGDQP